MSHLRRSFFGVPVLGDTAPVVVLLILGLPVASRLQAQEPTLDSATATVQDTVSSHGRILPEGKLPADIRLGHLKDLDGYFPFKVSASPAEWEVRAAKVRRQLQIALGLWPMPTRAPLKPVVHGAVDMGDYTVERVYFESVPGFYVTGSLYRPKGKTGKLPGVLFPHGHWADGRFHDSGLDAVRNEIFVGGERFEDGGRSPLQSLCVGACRLGCVVFHYDMIGYADSTQISFDLGHRFGKQRPQMNTLENWGLYSTQAEANLQSIMGLQTINSIAALDFLATLEDVDSNKLAVTGASGGGTQTFILGALDPRPAVLFPAVMVSTAMQGGCTCENCSLLRVETGNVEFAAMAAPKPQGLTAADDWTKEMATKGFPELAQHYAMMGKKDNAQLFALTHFGHNYNYVSRLRFYKFLNEQFALGLKEPVLEADYKRLSNEQMTVWGNDHPRPSHGDAFEIDLLRALKADADKQLAALAPDSPEKLAQFREVVGGALAAIFVRDFPNAKELTYDQRIKADLGDYIVMEGMIRQDRYGEETPTAFLFPKTWNKKVVIGIAEEGKSRLFEADGKLREELKTFVDKGFCVVMCDLFLQGEFLKPGQTVTKTAKVENPREFAGYTLGYNHSLFAQRVHDLLRVVSFVKSHERSPEEITIVAIEGTGPIAAAAAAITPSGVINKLAINTAGFRFGKLLDYRDPNFLPGGAKYGDLPAMLALAAPAKLLLFGEPEAPQIVKLAYDAAKADQSLIVSEQANGEELLDFLEER
jgi:hypothetical protein